MWASGGLPVMTRNSDGPCLSAIFVDYDNIYLSLKRKDEEAARRFAKEAASWVKAIEQGQLITPTNGVAQSRPRRIVMSRCYGNPVPRRNARDNSTDMNSFPFVRHHFLRAGFEIVDCPPLTAQLKNSSDIRMVMDMRDYLTHETRFDEFIILSSDADFTPVLQRLRSHARTTAIFANEHTATPYTAICDGEIREADLARYLVEGPSSEASEPQQAQDAKAARATSAPSAPSAPANLDTSDTSANASATADILAVVIATMEVSDHPVAMEAMADRVQRALGSERTVGSNWAGTGSFRSFLSQSLPDRIRLTPQAPHMLYLPERQAAAHNGAGRAEPAPAAAPAAQKQEAPAAAKATAGAGRSPAPTASRPAEPSAARRPGLSQQSATALQQSVARIHEACQAPPLAPPEYRMLFELLSAELREFTFNGDQTIANVVQRAHRAGFEPRRDDVRFVVDVVREADPYFEQGVSPQVFAGRFRNFVIARCRGQGIQLSSDEIDLVDAWFTGGIAGAGQRTAPEQAPPQVAAQPASGAQRGNTAERWRHVPAGMADQQEADVAAMPRIQRARARG